jgi:TRAP-type uncharacterized transport system substrate-binding protein
MDTPNIQSRITAVREYYHTRRLQLIIVLVSLVVAVLLGAAIAALRPLPPRTLVMATGPEGSAAYEVGARYREILARSGIDLQLLPTAGAIENLARLRDPRSHVDVGVLQSGTTGTKESPDLQSLGTIYYEPLWGFFRETERTKGLQVLRYKGIEIFRGKKIAIGPEGSGTRALALKMFARNALDKHFAEFLPLAPQQAGEKLLRGEIDAALMVTSWDAPVVQRLLTAQGIGLANFPRTDAYIALYPFLNKVVLPEGVADLAKDRPPSDVLMFAPKASLVVRKDLHPALQHVLLDAAEQIHSGPGIFQKAGQFPAAEAIDLPLSNEARQFYKSGKPFFQRYLPVWLAVMVERLLVLLIPVIGLIYPLVQILPSLYDKAMRKRIYRLYGELRFLEKDVESRREGQSIVDLNDRLDQLEEKTSRLQVPATYMSMLYTLRDHIIVVRGRLKRP